MQMNFLEELKTNTNVELIKHTAAVHIKSDLSLVDRKVVNILLKNAYNNLDSEKYHAIQLSEIKNAIGWSGKNYLKLKNSLTKLVSTKIEWNIFKKDKKNEWVISSLLASASITSGKCIYEYSSRLKELFKNPNIYSKINLLIQNNFKSKYSLILWEFLTDCLTANNKDAIGTEWIKIEDYKNLLGVEANKYKTFKALNVNIIKLPLDEINQVSDLEVAADYQKLTNRVVAIRFFARRKGEKNAVKTIEISSNKTEEKIANDIPKIAPKLSKDNIKNELLNFCKISSSMVESILVDYELDRISENLKYIKSEHAKGLIKSLPAYSYKAIKNDFRLVEEVKISPVVKHKIIEKKKIEFNNNDPFWINSIQILKDNFEERIFDQRITELNFVTLKNNVIWLATKNKFLRDNIKIDQQPEIETLLNKKVCIIAVEDGKEI